MQGVFRRDKAAGSPDKQYEGDVVGMAISFGACIWTRQ